MKKVLLIEPNYANKYPPIALMKLATYYRKRGDWEVVFYKGDLNLLVIERIVDRLVADLNAVDPFETDWRLYKDILMEFIRTRKSILLESLPRTGPRAFPLLETYIQEAKDEFWKGTWQKHPEWVRVGVTTLFTFYWDITVETIEFAKKLVKNPKDLMVGGVLASLQPDELEKATGIRPFVGVLNQPGILDPDDTQCIDELELDYSILDEIDYRYPMSNAYYGYMTRGCIRHCPFCAVPKLEPHYTAYIPMKARIDKTSELYGPQKDLLLMDNNVLASEHFPEIIEDIISCGFGKGSLFRQPNLLDIAVRNLENGVNDRAYTRRLWRLLQELYTNACGETSYRIYSILEKYHLEKMLSSTKENLLAAADEIKPFYDAKIHNSRGKVRKIDFNQGVDGRLFTEEKVKLLSRIAIHPLRIAFDDLKLRDQYERAIRMSVAAGLKDFSNYLLYNFNDTPEELYERLRINVELSDELNVSIYSFPMKYHPIVRKPEWDQDYSHNRDYIGTHWNRKYIRAIQAILNSTKGKIGRGKTFFEKAFGENPEEFQKLLEMPETFIIYRLFFEWLGSDEARACARESGIEEHVCDNSTDGWWKRFQLCRKNAVPEEWSRFLTYIHTNDFDKEFQTDDIALRKLIDFYRLLRKEILTDDSEICRMKKEYDSHPTIAARRKKSPLNMD